MLIAAPTPHTSRHQQRLATMRHGPLHKLAAVHGGGIRKALDTCSFRIAALQLVLSSVLWQVVVRGSINGIHYLH